MLPPRKNRISLENEPDVAAFPTIIVSLSEIPSDDSSHEISILDINTDGIGIVCTVQLNVGQRVFFSEGHQEWDFPKYGIIMWTFKISDGFRAGIKFA